MKNIWKQKGNTFDYLNSLLVLCKWLVAGCAIGLVVGGISALFGHTLLYVNELRKEYPLIVRPSTFAARMMVSMSRKR